MHELSNMPETTPRSELIVASIEHVRELMTWFSDEPAVRVWGGPAFHYPFTEASFLDGLRWGQMPTYALMENKVILTGFGQLYFKAGRAHLARIAVAPSRRGRGHGHVLVERLIEKGQELFQCKEQSLYVMRANDRALRCYLKAGFVQAPVPPGEREYADRIFMVRKVG